MGTNITAINPPPARDTNYVQKIIDSFNGVDAHDHSSGKGLPVARVADGVVSTASLADGSVTTDKLAATSVTAAKLGTGAVTTAKILDAAVTGAKLEAENIVSSSSSGSYSNSTTSYTDIVSLSFTSNGRSVRLSIQPAATTDSGDEGVIGFTSSGVSGGRAFFKLLRGSTAIATFSVSGQTSTGGLTQLLIAALLGDFIDQPAAGTYTYKLQGKSTTTTNVVAKAVEIKLVARQG